MPPSSLPTPADVQARTLYLYYSGVVHGLEGQRVFNQNDVIARTLYLYVNHCTHGWPVGGEPLDQDDVLARVLYLYVSITHDRTKDDVEARALYLYNAYTEDELFPWLMLISPEEVRPGQQLKLYGDGFGDTPEQEGSLVRLGDYDPTQLGPGIVLGVVSWLPRSPGMHPANSGTILPAIVVVVAVEADSDYVSVEQVS